jgi:hypothetical protein
MISNIKRSAQKGRDQLQLCVRQNYDPCQYNGSLFLNRSPEELGVGGHAQRALALVQRVLQLLNLLLQRPEPVFLNVYGARESIPRNEFRQPM